MFKRDPNDKRRVIIVDFSHMAWSYAFGQATGLTSTLTVNGVPQTVDTTIPAYTIKTLHRWSEGGKILLQYVSIQRVVLVVVRLISLLKQTALRVVSQQDTRREESHRTQDFITVSH